MNRRAYLAGVGTVGVAGCLGFGESTDEPAADSGGDDTTADPADQSPATDEDETDDPQPDDPEESDPDTEPEESDPDVDSESDDRQQSEGDIEFERSIERAADQYRAALAEYGRSAGASDPTFLAVLPSTEVDTYDAREYLNAAADMLWSETRDLANTEAQAAQVREYRTYEAVIPKLSRIQRAIHRAYTKIESPEQEPSYSMSPSELTSAKSDHEELQAEFDEMNLYMTEIQTKHDQQRWQIRLLEWTFTGLMTIGSTRDIDNRSRTELQLARNEFERVIDELEDPTSAPPEDTTDREFLELAIEWYEFTDETLRETAA